MNRLTLIVVLIICVLPAAACGTSNRSSVPPSSSGSQHQLTNLHDISQLRKAFNTASKRPRLILLVSPT